MPYFAIQNLHTIQIEEEKISSLNNNSNNLLSKKWYREFAQIDQSDELHISVTTANGSRILTFGSIRLETKTLKEINFTAQTTNITKLILLQLILLQAILQLQIIYRLILYRMVNFMNI